jgi:starvation-inducible DNA-binding protein
MNPNIGLSEKNRGGLVKLLQSLLADQHVLYLKTRNAHWNVSGPHFGHLHEFFQKQYVQIEGFIDDTAERIQQLGHPALGTYAEYLKLTRLKEFEGHDQTAQDYLKELLKDQEAVIQQLRQDVKAADDKFGDVGTADFLTSLMQSHEKMAWMLRASLKS